ncbi:TetR/AcrR family transcriptional regulator [Mycolicibacterium goodii]|uniref:TetR/AcrR family transcriptional regulator n=1 Tax=Mycolicibacterium goodii TaxID=134601 RepID=UPI000C25D85C|nr:TetR/AcrR family transcriptional regulator [Mycolicibacterium goodii]MBU8807619.1 TetR/AcrR family transcriptional regulator [Mycolicibacterium goodii]MBU8820291.1 TetR/AcrR family transcriptional regulator [Mycolicibacterium goodii]PJK20030.1 TetR family transcriptional regulator [Mycolicibacterium goodii]ULN47541.1 TetR/AcrR family transcriptional regulator [Mycolicibacterium goodii]
MVVAMNDAPRKKPRQQRSRETVEVVLEAAAQVFNREGLAATTNRIAERAGVSIGSVYQYFPNKRALLNALAQRHVQEASDRLDAVFTRLRRDAPAFDQAMRSILAAVVDLHHDRPGLHRLMHRVAAPRDDQLKAMQLFETRLAEEVAFHLVRCGRVPDPDDALAAARTVVHAVDAHLHRVLPHRDITQEAATDELVDLVERLLRR